MKTVRMEIFLVVLLLTAMIMVPTVSADEKNITINITAPEEGDVFYLDVVPAFISVQGMVDAPNGIRNVSITNGEDVVVCGSNYGIHFDISCDVPCYSNTDHITVSVLDFRGNSDSARRNFTRYTGPPPPGTIRVTGWVVDKGGQPVPNATIIFDRCGKISQVARTTTSGTDGSYKMKKTWGIHQRVSVQKDGYQTLVREMTFKIYDNELNLTLTPVGTSVPGFNFDVAISAVLICSLLVVVKRNL